MFIRDRIQETTPMFWLHSLSVVRIQNKKEKRKEDGVKTEGFQDLKMAKDTLLKHSILYSQYCFIKSNILKDTKQLFKKART